MPMGDSAIKLVKPVYNYNGGNNTNGYSRANQSQGTAQKPQASQGQGSSTPTFGIKGRTQPEKDMFQYKGQTMTRDEVKTKSHDDVYKHEAAHLSKAGKYATTGICIDFDGNGFATSGHVGVSMPKLDPKNLKETINHADTVIASAEAPASFDELSAADRSVAAQARAVKSQALAMQGSQKDKQPGSKLDMMA